MVLRPPCHTWHAIAELVSDGLRRVKTLYTLALTNMFTCMDSYMHRITYPYLHRIMYPALDNKKTSAPSSGDGLATTRHHHAQFLRIDLLLGQFRRLSQHPEKQVLDDLLAIRCLVGEGCQQFPSLGSLLELNVRLG